ncbi:MAG TPA: glutaredoxin family protein [Ideonella sp.]|uniref:glutaredoxin family protein n=1 Tax=Ideonella sp. TaxID=1929293 RepID=UPI002E31017F|nr:glutaredoxin family protein [Ideonella sp.]HEX5683173.1 glutaredoxin family protein [Ideonella sp.]
MTTIRLPLVRSLGLVTAALTLASLTLPAHAVYKIVGPDGKVTYSDTPPPAGSDAKVKPVSVSSGGGAPNLSGLPVELREAATKYPVTLYSATGCRPCDTGRQLLQTRGVPFAEKMVGNTSADTAALQSLTGESTLPVLTIGQQQLKGVTPSEWNSYLDAAGYPGQSKLPANYRAPGPTPLVQPAAAPTTADATPAAPADAAAPARAASGPNIRF